MPLWSHWNISHPLGEHWIGNSFFFESVIDVLIVRNIQKAIIFFKCNDVQTHISRDYEYEFMHQKLNWKFPSSAKFWWENDFRISSYQNPVSPKFRRVAFKIDSSRLSNPCFSVIRGPNRNNQPLNGNFDWKFTILDPCSRMFWVHNTKGGLQKRIHVSIQIRLCP